MNTIATKLLELVSCPICGATDSKPYRFEERKILGKVLKFGLNCCSRCHMQYISPRLTDAAQKLFYTTDYSGSTLSGARHTDASVGAAEYRQFEKYILKYLPDGGDVLDVGCGIGNLAFTIKKHSQYHVKGVEISQEAANQGRERGFDIFTGSIEDYSAQPESFDAVVLLYVLEHVGNPLSVLKAAHTLLRPEGILSVAVPNYRYLKIMRDNFLVKVLHGSQATLNPEEHLQNFTPVNLKRLLDKAGFSVELTEAAHPLAYGSLWVRLLKNAAYAVIVILAKCGWNMGGIHVVARKK